VSIDVPSVIHEAIRQYGAETSRLLPVAENRYNRSLFSSTGQYDWFSAQALYCLIRHVRPRTIIEVSTSSGYSTVIQALALQQNGAGGIHTFEIAPEKAASAARVLSHFGVRDVVTIHVGDARIEADRVGPLSGPVLLFLDSLHTEAFARWFIERWVLTAPADRLMHIHDIMPPTARVRFDGGPPWRHAWMESLRDVVRRLVGRPTRRELGHVDCRVIPAASSGELPTIDGVITTEAILVNQVVQQMPAQAYAYLYDLADGYPELQPRRFDDLAVKRQNRRGRPMEWNETVWLETGAFLKGYQASNPSPQSRS
jgi:hypothetical protein